MRALAILLGLSIIATEAGCGRTPPPIETTQPATAPAPTTVPGRSALPALITIDNHEYEFPPAIALVSTRDDELVAQVYTDDPPQAARDDYMGNGFCLEMPLELNGSTLAGAEWAFKASNTERVETVDGIYLRGLGAVLQPNDVKARFESAGPISEITLEGTFILFDDMHNEAPPRIVPVTGRFEAQLQTKASAAAQSAEAPR